MAYDSQISFTLDTICPWTYLAYRRLTKALKQFSSRDESAKVQFSLKFLPYQLYPEASAEGEAKYEWYKRERYQGSEEKMDMYTAVMAAYGRACDPPINFIFGGTVANTLPAHRLIQHYQEDAGGDVARKLIDSLYRQYFEEERHPNAPETLLAATREAGIADADAQEFVRGEEGLSEVKLLIREQAQDGIDAVPHVVFEGRRRDITVQGAKEEDEYLKTMLKIAAECQ